MLGYTFILTPFLYSLASSASMGLVYDGFVLSRVLVDMLLCKGGHTLYGGKVGNRRSRDGGEKEEAVEASLSAARLMRWMTTFM